MWAGAILMAVLFGSAAAAQGLPPEPGSTPEYQEGDSKLVGAALVSGGPTDPFMVSCLQGNRAACEQSRKTGAKADEWRQTAARTYREGVDLLQKACAKNDADGCSTLARHQNIGPYLPAPVAAARRNYAIKAASLFQARCSPDREIGYGCINYSVFLKLLRDGEAKFAAGNRIPDANQIFLQGGRILAKRCTALATPAQLERSTQACHDAENLLANLDQGAVVAVQETLCSRGYRPACDKLGKQPPAVVTAEAAQKAQCEGGDAKACTLMAYRAYSGPQGLGTLAEAKRYASKACDLNFSLGCVTLGSVLIKQSAPNYPAAADAFGKACKLGPAQVSKDACSNEKKLREALAKPAQVKQ